MDNILKLGQRSRMREKLYAEIFFKSGVIAIYTVAIAGHR
jgi:hypothetical protein